MDRHEVIWGEEPIPAPGSERQSQAWAGLRAGSWRRDTPIMERKSKGSLKERAIEELRVFWLLALYLWVFLGSFTLYRRLILAETGTSYLHYGIALIEALVVAKVVLVGRMFGFSHRFENRRLIVPVLYKTVLFAILVALFSVAEKLVEGWIHGKGLLDGFREIEGLGLDEIAARMLTLVVAFVPVFAFGELSRVIGAKRLAAMFFTKPETQLQSPELARTRSP